MKINISKVTGGLNLGIHGVTFWKKKKPYKTIEKLNKHHFYMSYQNHGEKQTESRTTTPH